MRIGELINLYKRMRAALLVSVPLALWWLVYLFTGGEMLASWLLSVWVIFPLIDLLPSAAEVQRILKTRQTSNHIWYLIESQDTGEVRVCK